MVTRGQMGKFVTNGFALLALSDQTIRTAALRPVVDVCF